MSRRVRRQQYGTEDVAAIQQLFDKYEAAAKSKDAKAVCDLQTPSLSEQMTREAERTLKFTRNELQGVSDAQRMPKHATCEIAVRMMLSTKGSFRIKGIAVDGSSATGRVGYDTWKFARVDGDWKVDHVD